MLTSKVQLGYVLTEGGGQAVQCGLSCPPAQNFRENWPSDKGNQTDVGCKHLSLAEMMFTSLTTKYSKITVQ